MKEFNRVATMSAQEPVSRGFMFEYVMEKFSYQGWRVTGESLMNAFEKTFGGIEASAGTVRDNREKFISAIQEELKERVGEDLAGHAVFTDLINKTREVLQPPAAAPTPVPAPAKKAQAAVAVAPVPGQP